MRDAGRSPDVLPFQPLLVQHLQPVGPRLDDVENPAGLPQVDLAVAVDRAAEDFPTQPQLLANLRAIGRVEREHRRGVVHRNQLVANQQGRRPPHHAAHLQPLLLRLGHIARPGGVDGEQRPHHPVVGDILFAVSGVDRVPHHQRGGVHPPQRGIVRPHHFPRPGLQGIDRAIARAEHDHPLATNCRQHRGAVGGVHRPQAGAGDPDRLAIGLVEGDEPVGRHRILAPPRHHPADDHQVFKDQRHVGPAAIGVNHPVFFTHRVLPQGFPRVTIDSLEDSAHPQREDVARLNVASHARPAHPLGGHVGQEDVVGVLPQHLPGRRVETDNFLPLAVRVGKTPRQQVDLPIHDDGGRPGADLGVPPQQVFALGRPAGDQSLLAGDSIHLGTPPMGPVEGIGRRSSRPGGGNSDRQQHHPA